jgi:hypothetical protein
VFIIFGSPRSGTTLLATTLSQHDQLVVPGETDLIIPLAFLYDRVKNPRVGKSLIEQFITTSQGYYSLKPYLTPREVHSVIKKAEYAADKILIALYARIARNAGKTLAGDKSPNDLNFARILYRTGVLGGSIKIIHVVRDVRDVILSVRKANWAPQVETYFPRFWSNANLHLHHLMKTRPEAYFFLKFEDMVARPAEVFPQLTDFLDVPFRPAMLDHSRRGAEYQGVKEHENLRKPFQAGRVGVWQTEMSAELLALVERQAYEALEDFGYVDGVEGVLKRSPAAPDHKRAA